MSGDGKDILLIDDDRDFQHVVRSILEPQGYQVRCASTLPEGREALAAGAPDLLLLDIMMASPSDGFHLAYEMKQDESLKDVPIIMISSISQTMGMDYAQELGSDYIPADRFIEKPIDAQTLRNVVEQTLTRLRK